MDEETSAEKQGSISASRKQNSDKGRAKVPKYGRQANKFKSKYKAGEWSVLEKSRLLEALKRYDWHNISSIATLVETKSEEEVEEIIKAYKGVESFRGTNNRVDGPGDESAPIEAWIDLVQEMTKHDPADYTQFIPKVLGLITRNEKFADSGFPQLKWRNIYQFLTHLTEDRVEKQKLTDMESLVLLDMMHNIGDTLLKSDTSEQKRVLDFKYNLLNFKSDNPTKQEKEINIHRIAQALSNDCEETAENVQGTSSDKPNSFSGVDRARPPQNYDNSLGTRIDTELTSQSSAVTSWATQRSSAETAASTSFTVSHHSKPGGSHSATSSSISDQQCNRGKTNNQNTHNEAESGSTNDSADGESSADVRLFNSRSFGEKFVRPKYFSLNPLCVPTLRLAFKPKTNT